MPAINYRDLANSLNRILTQYSYRVNPKSQAGEPGKVNKNVRQFRIIPPDGVTADWINSKVRAIKTGLPKRLESFVYNKITASDIVYHEDSPNSDKYSSVSFKLGKDEFDVVITTGKSSLSAESKQILKTTDDLRAVMREASYITLVIGTERYNVDGFEKVAGVPKADAVFKYKNSPVVFCSLKKGAGPGNFQQYGGWARDFDLSTRAQIDRVREFKAFVQRIENIFMSVGLKRDANGRYDFNMLKRGSNFATYLTDSEMANKSLFGKKFGDTNWGTDNCQILIDGDIRFAPHPEGFEIFGTFNSKINPLINPKHKQYKVDSSDIYTPALFIYKSENQGLNQGGFSNARASVWPNNRVIKNYVELTNRIETLLASKSKSSLDEVKRLIVKPQYL